MSGFIFGADPVGFLSLFSVFPLRQKQRRESRFALATLAEAVETETSMYS